MKFYLPVFLSLLIISSCKHDPDLIVTNGNYPPDVEEIIVNRCATSGCHNTISKGAAGGLDLSTWDKMFDGTATGAVTIPFRGDFSTMLYFTNTDSTQGISQQPTMPVNLTPLTSSEYQTLRNWINAGAPDKNGTVMFADNPQRHKYYVTNQGCDVVQVFDADRNVIMRVVDVGIVPGSVISESPHNIRVTPDGKYWVVVFLTSDVLQVFDAATDQLVRNIPLGGGQGGEWNTCIVANDSRTVYAVDYDGGRVWKTDIISGTSTYVISNRLDNQKLHGIALNAGNDTIYVTGQLSNFIYKIPVNDASEWVRIPLFKPLQSPPVGQELLPHDIVFSPDYSKYFVSCQSLFNSEVRVMDTKTDTLLAIIPVGLQPQELAVSPSRNLVFCTNQYDSTSFPGITGSVSIISINSLTEISKVRVGYQPHGIAVDEVKKKVYVANRNISSGQAPHHTSVCGGSNGSMSMIDLNTLQVVQGYKPELSVDPYSVSVRP